VSAGSRRLYSATSASVSTAAEEGPPVAVGGVAVEAIREEWLVEDRWWTPEPLRRHYYELVLGDGRNVTVFRCESSERWNLQRS